MTVYSTLTGSNVYSTKQHAIKLQQINSKNFINNFENEFENLDKKLIIKKYLKFYKK